MSKLNAAQRKVLPPEDFGDPANKLFPIVDQADVDSASHLVGKAKNPGAVKARIIAIAKRKGLDIPDAWKTGAKMSGGVPMRFSLEPTSRRVEGDYAVYPNSLLWVAGDYADKQFAMTPEENWLAVENFTPVGGNIEHTDFLSGVACQVRSIRLDPDDPARIRAEVAVPLALDGLMGTRERGLSCEWNRVSKELQGLALTTNPRIPEAALMSDKALVAFAAASPHTTSDGQRVVQAVHDMTAKSGAICSPNNPNGTQSYSSSYFVSGGEARTIQQLHDNATAGGAKCNAMPAKGSASYTAMDLLFAGSRHNKADQADIQKIHDLAANQGADCAPAGMSNPDSLDRGLLDGTRPKYRAGGQSMASKFGHWFKQGRESREIARDAGAELPEETIFSTLEDEAALARQQAHDDQVAKMSAQLAEAAEKNKLAEAALFAANAQRIQGEAAAFVDGLIVGGKLYPAEREGAIALYAQAGMDDATSGAVTFANGATGSRVEQFKKSYESRPAHGLTQEQLEAQVKDGVAFGLLPGGKDKESAEQRQERILSLTPQGRAHLAQRRKEKQA